MMKKKEEDNEEEEGRKVGVKIGTFGIYTLCGTTTHIAIIYIYVTSVCV